MLPVIIGVVVIALVLYVIMTYNTLQRLKTQIQAAIQEIGNQLKRQASLIPNLESAVKAYFKQEKDIFGMFTDARKSVTTASETGNVGDIDKAIDQINAIVPRLNIAIEDNPEMKSNESLNKFMAELTDTADKLSYARRSVIDLTQMYNEKLVTFPSNLIANFMGFKPEKGLEMPPDGTHLKVSDEEMKDVKVNL